MTTSPYSKDLRNKVMNYLKKGKSQKEASEVFGIHVNTISRWYTRYRKEGNCLARVRLGPKARVDYKEVELFVKNNPDSKLADIGNKFGISGWHASRILKKMGYSYKKKTLAISKQAKKKETNTKN
jgi:transposase